jgi:DNA-directed RNA polymerase specialized sigma24 family protein
MKKKFTDDEQLFEAIIKGDKQAIEQFREDKITPLTYLALEYIGNKQDARGIAINAFYKTLQSGVAFESLNHIYNYIRGRVRFACLDYIKGLPGYIPIEDVEHTLISEQDFEAKMIKAEYYYALYKQIKKLPSKTDRDILLKTLEGKNPVEIAREIGRTDRYVRRRLESLGKKIRNELIANKIITVLFLLLFI